MKILVTGGNGFLGSNLRAQLQNEGFENVMNYTVDQSLADLDNYTKECDFVFHLAGVNRPKTEKEFYEGNTNLTEQLVKFLEKNNNLVPILLSSSVQAEQDNPYGDSKKLSEQAIFEYGQRNNVEVLVYRLKNLYGKWSRPNYNSVVATFCYNISRNLPIQLNNPEAELTLSYIDDVVQEFVRSMKNSPSREGRFCMVPQEVTLTLQALADKLVGFKENRQTLIMPSLKAKVDRNLYATYLSYLAEDDFSYQLKKNSDDRGWLAEFIKSEDNGQIFISTTKPGVTRGNHWHHTKVEKFLVIQGEAMISFRHIFSDKVIDYPVKGEDLEVVDIPAGYTHSITNTGKEDIITLFWACELFDQDNPDTYYVEV